MVSQKPFDPTYGFGKVVRPFFFEVELRSPFREVATALKSYGRVFPASCEVVQVAHVLKKRDRFYVCHFKSLLYLDGVADKDSITGRDLQEIGGALDFLLARGMVAIARNHSFLAPPAHVCSVLGDSRKWKQVSKYTFKTPH